MRREVKEKTIKKLPKPSKRKMMKTWTRAVLGCCGLIRFWKYTSENPRAFLVGWLCSARQRRVQVTVMKSAHHLRVFFPKIGTDSVIRKKHTRKVIIVRRTTEHLTLASQKCQSHKTQSKSEKEVQLISLKETWEGSVNGILGRSCNREKGTS